MFKTPTKNEAPSYLAWPKSLPPLTVFCQSVESNICIEAKAASPAVLKAYLESVLDWEMLGVLTTHVKSRPTSPVTKEEFKQQLKTVDLARERRKKKYQILKYKILVNVNKTLVNVKRKNKEGNLQDKLSLWQKSLRKYPVVQTVSNRPKWRF